MKTNNITWELKISRMSHLIFHRYAIDEEMKERARELEKVSIAKVFELAKIVKGDVDSKTTNGNFIKRILKGRT